jgi:mannose-6-phosphate isomerase-like protein (cupin superfamily)
MSNYTDYRDHLGVHPERFHKAALFQTPRLLLGLNAFEPGQQQHVHSHENQDKFYVVVEGEGQFTVGDEQRICGPGSVILAPAGVPHGVVNTGHEHLVVLLGIA